MVRLSERLRLLRPAAAPLARADGSPRTEPVEVSAANPVLARRDLRRQLAPGELGSEKHTASCLLYERLGSGEIAAAEELARSSPAFQRLLSDSTPPVEKWMLTLHCAMWHGLESAAEKTGLQLHQPPEEVHAMARGPLAAAGGLYEADLVANALTSVGVRMSEIGSALDFGCSSGRVVGVLAAAYPSVRWYGCDPNEPAITWAREKLPGIDFFSSGNEPPLPLQTNSQDLVFAISIWSHFEPRLGLRWFEEMHRLLAPGGHLVLTTHGLTSVSFYAGNGLRTPEQCEEIAEALYQRGWWYAPEFGETGDWGVVNPAWGTSFLSPEWLLTELCPRWRVLEFAPGRNASNQDVYVLQRT